MTEEKERPEVRTPGQPDDDEQSNRRMDSSIPEEGDQVGYKGRWGSIPVSVFSVPVSAPARLTLAYLFTYVNPHKAYYVFPSQERIAHDLNIKTTRTVRNHLTELIEAGVLRKAYRSDVEDWGGNPNARGYFLVEPDPPENDRKKSSKGATGKEFPVRPEKDFRSDRKEVSAEVPTRTNHQNKPEDDHPRTWEELAQKEFLGTYRTQDVMKKIAHVRHLIEDGKEISDPIAYVQSCLENMANERDRNQRSPMKEVCPDCGRSSDVCECEWGSNERRRKYALEDNFA
jgi:hypothetical protein